MIPLKLNKTHIKLVAKHLCELKDEDRRLRFGGVLNNEMIKSYVEKSFKDKDSQWFGCLSHNKIISACHAAIYNGEGELGCSVSIGHRGKGLAQKMFDRAVTYLRSNGITNVYMHCLTENQAMRHIAKKNDMTIISCYGETDARVEVIPGDSMSAIKDAYLDRMAIYDMMFRTNTEMYESFLEKFGYDKGFHITRRS